MELVNPAIWYQSWRWSLPLIMLTVTIHVFGLQFISTKFVSVLNGATAVSPARL
jgi:hypothetical protein